MATCLSIGLPENSPLLWRIERKKAFMRAKFEGLVRNALGGYWAEQLIRADPVARGLDQVIDFDGIDSDSIGGGALLCGTTRPFSARSAGASGDIDYRRLV